MPLRTDTLESKKRKRLAEELAKLDPKKERELADESLLFDQEQQD